MLRCTSGCRKLNKFKLKGKIPPHTKLLYQPKNEWFGRVVLPELRGGNPKYNRKFLKTVNQYTYAYTGTTKRFYLLPDGAYGSAIVVSLQQKA